VGETAFTGERLHEGDELFQVDLARHRAAYEFARPWAANATLLDLGCGSGYGSASLAADASRLVGVDRVRPDAVFRHGRAAFVRADLCQVPLAPESFDLVLSFQVIEHLRDPAPYLDEMARVVRRDGTVLVTTPNRLTSDGMNPFHVHEYEADELTDRLRAHFDEVEMHGVGASPEAARYLEARLRRLRLVARLDPLRVRDRLPRGLVEWLFGRLAPVVRRSMQRSGELPRVTVDDFPVGPAAPDCVDLLAICRGPRQ